MNANELANEILEFYHDPDGLPYLIGEAATMLRQLQAENEALKALLKDESESFDRTASHMAGEYIAYKDLSDQEIMNLFYQTSGQDPIGFAKAILRKAGEK